MAWSPFTFNYDGARIDAIALWFNGEISRLNICCDRYNNDIVSFREYVAGKKIYYALENPIVTEIEERDFNLDYLVWNGGTEEALASKPSSALRAEITYGFNAVGKIKELEEKINSGGGGVSKEYVDTKLTELSTQVGTLSEEMANKQDVYVAEYGVTTREQIKAAWEANKHIVCVYGGKLFNLTNYGDEYDIYFACVYYSVELLRLSVAGNWTRQTIFFESTAHKVNTISASSTDTQYPSAKAVYDFVQSAIGNVINGEY